MGHRAAELAVQASLWCARAACGAAALGYLGLFAWLAYARAGHPFELEWMEGGMVDHVARLLHGKPLFVAPSIAFVPYIYNPLFYYVALPFTWIFGLDFLALRLVSIVASFAALGLIFLIVRREARAFWPALFAAGLYAATYRLSGAWFDVGRVDSLEVALSLGTLYLGRDAQTRGRWIACAVISFLAFAAKQPAGLLMPALGLCLLLSRGMRAALWFGLPALGILVGSVLVCNAASHGWYWFYAFEVPTTHVVIDGLKTDFWKHEVFATLPVAVVLAFYFLTRADHGPTDETGPADDGRLYFGLMLGTMLAMSFASRVHSGSWLNDNMPAHAALAVFFGLGAGAVLRDTSTNQRRGAEVFVLLLTAAQYLFLFQDPRSVVPTEADRREGEHLMQVLSGYRGEVLLQHHAFLMRRIGRPSYAQEMAVVDVLRTTRDARGAKAMLEASYVRAFSRKRFAAVILDERIALMPQLERYYRLALPTFIGNRAALVPKSGATIRPLLLYLPK